MSRGPPGPDGRRTTSRGRGSTWGSSGPRAAPTPLTAKLSSASSRATPPCPSLRGPQTEACPPRSPPLSPTPALALRGPRADAEAVLASVSSAGPAWGRHPPAALSRASRWYVQTKRFLPLTCSRSGRGSREWGPGSRVREGPRGRKEPAGSSGVGCEGEACGGRAEDRGLPGKRVVTCHPPAPRAQGLGASVPPCPSGRPKNHTPAAVLMSSVRHVSSTRKNVRYYVTVYTL